MPGGLKRWLVHRETPSPNCDERALPVSMVVLHYTGMQSGAEALERLCDPEAKVSAHYLIDEDGSVAALVPEDRRAWHAGRSYWRGITDVNSASIGIELVNPGHEWGYRAFPQPQMASLLPLLADIVDRHDIAPTTSSAIRISRRRVRKTRVSCSTGHASRGCGWRFRCRARRSG